ncbi:MAG: S8 family serine peptidase [Blastocatellia bacterium]|nr:S8 family serine peptidase [Blastocatellia bacterium]
MYFPSRLTGEVRDLLKSNLPRWNETEGVCRDCVDHFARAKARINLYFPQGGKVRDFTILPTPLRLGASPRYTGRGVTMAFLDSGFFGHPDLLRPVNRIVQYHNIVTGEGNLEELKNHDVSSWHGMMTSVVAAGNGFLSEGLYRGIASDAKLVLVKVGSARRIKHDDIRRGFDWVIENQERYNIRVVNVSCGGDYEASYLHDSLSQSAEEAVRRGIVVVAAVGNAGFQSNHPVVPPASAPSVITVGGLDDKNSLDSKEHGMYHSSYGPTVDGLQKPEVIAPGIWVAAPILPQTTTADEAMLLDRLNRANDDNLKVILRQYPGIDADLDASLNLATYLVRHLVEIKLKDRNVISGHYKHVDGTSFAAPIVTSVIAQILEANPELTPQQVKSILIKTSERLPYVETDRQGWGVINPRRAVASAIEFRMKHLEDSQSPLAKVASSDEEATDSETITPEKPKKLED